MNRSVLEAGIQALGLHATAEQVDALLAYAELLLKWNKTYNLTALRDPAQVISHHLLDSLVVIPYVGTGALLDVGSGGGLPGIPLAIMRPDLAVTLVDTVQKKTTFLQQVVIQLGLKNVTVHHARVENLVGQFQQISSRAFAELSLFVSLTKHLLAPEGAWLAMKGVFPDEELLALPSDVQCVKTVELKVPELDAERHLIFLKAVA